MSTVEELEARLVALEGHVAHQDSAIDDLNEMTTKQWTVIDALERRLADLKSRVDVVEDDVPSSGTRDPLPPHH